MQLLEETGSHQVVECDVCFRARVLWDLLVFSGIGIDAVSPVLLPVMEQARKLICWGWYLM